MRRLSRTGFAFLLAALFVAAFAYGMLADRTRIFPYGAARAVYRSARSAALALGGGTPSRPSGRWRRHELSPNELSITRQQQAEIEHLESVAYLSGSRPAGDRHGVIACDPERTWDGWNLVVSGHAPWAGLMDMQGNVVHEWQYAFRSVWPDNPISDEAVGIQHWRCARLCENGDLLAIFEGVGLIKLDKDSNLLWSRAKGYHHDLEILDDGTMYTLDQKAHIVPTWSLENPVLENYVTILDREGRAEKTVSLLTAFENSPYSPILRRAAAAGDLFHSNSIQLLDGTLSDQSPAFRAGNVLVSIRELDTIAVIDLDAESVVWASSGMWRRQHDATLLPNAHILLFDNQHGPGVSEVLEFDPFTSLVEWSYVGDDEHPFYSDTCGTSQRLPNGNTLIVESDNGRAFEVTTDGTIVWEYVSPYRAGNENELIATLFEVVRLPEDFPVDWIETTDREAPPSQGPLIATGE